LSEGRNTQSRKWQLTINNPLEHDLNHEKIKNVLLDMKPLEYFCMADEKGLEEETPHTHLYIHFNKPVRFSTIKNAFPSAHIEQARGTALQNRDYIAKQGKWENDDKHGTKIEGTYEEWGEMPVERQGARNDLVEMVEGIENGKTNCQLVRENPNNLRYMQHMNQYRQDMLHETYRDVFRTMYVEYVYGETEVGKTRHIFQMYNYCEVYRVTDYEHPFDNYQGEPIMVFDEYRSQLRISDMLNYLDGYPLKLKSRYVNKQACYTKVYIISNESLDTQYPSIQKEQPKTWAAFLRRIHKYCEYLPDGKQERDMSGLYFTEVEDNDDLPFGKGEDWQTKIEDLGDD
jgi:hypothetical protein